MVNISKHSGFDLYGVPALIVARPGMRVLYGFFLQSAHKDDKPSDIVDYTDPALAECQAIHNHAHEAYLAVSIILSLDLSIYGKLIKYLSNSDLMETDQYLRTHAKMNYTIVHWWKRAARYGLHAPPVAVIFAQDNKNRQWKNSRQ